MSGGAEDYRKRLHSYAADAVATLVAIMENDTAPAKTRIRAAKLILDIGWGKPGVESVICEVDELP